MNTASTNGQLLDTVSAASPTTIDEVIALMQGIDNLLSGDDGLKWFNLLYLLVTKQVREDPPANGFLDTGKIGRLLAIWDVRVARDVAWTFADLLQNLSGPARNLWRFKK